MPTENQQIHPRPSLKKVTASANVLDPRPVALYIAVGGTMSVTNEDDTTEAAIPVVAGTVIPYQPKKITAIVSASVYAFHN